MRVGVDEVQTRGLWFARYPQREMWLAGAIGPSDHDDLLVSTRDLGPDNAEATRLSLGSSPGRFVLADDERVTPSQEPAALDKALDPAVETLPDVDSSAPPAELERCFAHQVAVLHTERPVGDQQEAAVEFGVWDVLDRAVRVVARTHSLRIFPSDPEEITIAANGAIQDRPRHPEVDDARSKFFADPLHAQYIPEALDGDVQVEGPFDLYDVGESLRQPLHRNRSWIVAYGLPVVSVVLVEQ